MPGGGLLSSREPASNGGKHFSGRREHAQRRQRAAPEAIRLSSRLGADGEFPVSTATARVTSRLLPEASWRWRRHVGRGSPRRIQTSAALGIFTFLTRHDWQTIEAVSLRVVSALRLRAKRSGGPPQPWRRRSGELSAG
jgi:hypothetical protein